MSDDKKEKPVSRNKLIEDFVKNNAVAQDKGIGGNIRDSALSLLSGAISVPETAVGLADIATGGNVGKTLENQDGMFGFRPAEAKEAIAGWKTEKSQKQLRDFQDAEGFGAKFGQAWENKSLITNTVLESLPAMGAGGVVGRGIGAVAKGVSPIIAGAAGEGAVGAGLAAEQIRQQTDDGLLTGKQSGLAAATGLTTAGFGAAGGKIAQKLGLADVDTILAGGTRAAGANNKGIIRRTLQAAIAEGILEELPQSVSETVLQNIALDRPIEEGVDEAAVLGILSGGLMGGLAGAATKQRQLTDTDSTELVETEDMGQEAANYGQGRPNASGAAGLLGNQSAPQLGFGGVPNGQFNAAPTGEVFTGDQLNEYLTQQQERARAARAAGMTDINDTTETPEGYERFGTDPQLPKPSDFVGNPDGSLSSAADIVTSANNSAQQEQAARESERARRARGEILDRTQVPSEANGFGAFTPPVQTEAEKMGIDANKGGLSAAAALAVNSGVSAAAQQDASNTAESQKSLSTASSMLDVTPSNAASQVSANNQSLIEANTAKATGKDGQPKWWGIKNKDKAEAFIAKQNIGDTHEVVEVGGKATVMPKAQPTTAENNTTPVRAQRTPIKDEAKAKGKSFTADNDAIPYQWDVVDAKELVSSHSNTFGKNPSFPEGAQPRDRANAGYQAQVLDIQSKLNPKRLGESSLVSDGSPFVGRDDNVVESGNGRTIAIRRNYKEGKGESYRQFVQAEAERFGLDPETVAGMSEPVLVRRNLSDMDRNIFAQRANKDDKAAMGSTEQARIDAQALPSTDLIEFDSNGSMNLGNSRKFTQAFTKALGASNSNNMIAANGELSQSGKLRVNGAILHGAYESDKLTQAVTETLDASAKNVLKTLVDKAPQISRIKQLSKASSRKPSALSEDMRVAAEKYIDLVENGTDVDLYLANNDLFSEDSVSPQVAEIISDFNNNSRSAVKMGAALQARIDADTRASDPSSAGLFGNEEAPATPVNNKKRSVLRSKNQAEPVKETPKTLDYLKGKPALIGNNADGNPVYENKDGVRTVVDGGKAKTEAYRNVPSETGFKVSTPNRPDEFKLSDEVAPQPAVAKAETAEEEAPKTLGAGKDKRKFIGKNAAGEMIYEGENGIRSKRKGAFMASEPVKIQLGNDENPFDTSNRPDEFKLERELTAKEDPVENTPAETVADTPAKEKEIKDRFADNTFFDSDTVAAARARIKSKMGRVNSGIDPEMLTDGAILAGAYIESGVRKFGEYAKIMIDDLGKNITPYLLTFWNGARDYPGFDSTGMTNEVDSREQFNKLMIEYKPSKEIEAVLGEDKTQVKPKRKVTKPTNKDVMLRQDWGVKHIDGYVESDEFAGKETDNGLMGGVKDAFLKDSKAYLTATKKHLESLGYTMALDRKNKPMKVNVNAAGSAVSGDVSLSMTKDGSNIHVSIGQSSVPMLSMFRDMNADGTPVNNAPHPQQIAVMYRTSMNDGDTYATKQNNSSGNIWLSHKLTATELAEDINKTSNAIAARANKGVDNNDRRPSNDGNTPSNKSNLSTAIRKNGNSRDAGANGSGSVAGVEGVDGDSARSDDGNNNQGQSNRQAIPSENDGVGSQSDSDGSSDGSNQLATKPRGNLNNYRIAEGDLTRTGSWFDTAANNVAVIELIQEIDSQNRPATPAEQKILARYTGWGASEIANGIFPNPSTGKYKNDRWQALGEKLKDLLTTSEYETARSTTQFAHYTPPVVVESIYKALDQFGFSGGQVLEPASGVGVFNGLMPDAMSKNSQYTGVELDPTTGRIAQLLYPQSRMMISDYTKAKLPDNHFDVAVGNPPFANVSFDYGKGKSKQSFQLHDYFFAKTMDKVKPGGIVVFVTSTGTMDKKGDKARSWLSERADLVGAMRLPQTTFKENSGTETVTDIIFLRKRKDGEKPGGAKWGGLKTVDANGEDLNINEYFADNPSMIIGNSDHRTDQFGQLKYTVTEMDGDFGTNLINAIGSMDSNIFNPDRGSKAEKAKVMQMDLSPKSAEQKEGGVYLKDGVLMRVSNGIGQPLTNRRTQKGDLTDLTKKQVAFLTDYVPLRDALKQAQRDQLDDNPNWENSLANLNKVYDSFVKKHGAILKHSISEREVTEVETDEDGVVIDTVTTTRVQKTFANRTALFLDAESALVRGIENIVEGETSADGKQGVIEKGDFFKGRTLNAPKQARIASTQDALESSLNETGKLNIDRIAALAGKTKQQVLDELGDQVYFDPSMKAHALVEDYLSGNVVEKLEDAKKALRKNPAMQRNVDALEAVQPEPILAKDITANLGSAWVPTETIEQFATEVLGIKNAGISYSALTSNWKAKGRGGNPEYEAGRKSTVDLLDALLSSRKIVVTYKTPDGATVVNEIATQEANDVANKIKQAWADWVWADNARAATLSEIYNTKFNNIVPAYYGDGEHLTLDGMSSLIKLRPHQKRGIYRVIRQGDTYLNHAVGAGKTFTMIAAAMEEKRLGLINKPMFVVPNHMLDQFSQEFLMLYPAANLMVADTANFHTSNRRDFIAQASINNPDAIIITHSSFGKIGVSDAVLAKFLQEKVAEYREALDEAYANGDSKERSVKQMEKAMLAAVARIEKLLDSTDKDENAFFEDMGVDRLYVDEMHEFRKLSFNTRQTAVKGITAVGSQKAMDLQMKSGIIREKNPGRALVGASGTPITNTMGELFTVQRFFQPKQLEQDGLKFFDAWASQFGSTVEGLEQNTAGNYAMVSRFAKFQNMPELMSRVRSFMDVLTNYDLGSLVQRPEVVGGSREIVVTPVPDGFSDYQKKLGERIEAIKNRGGKPEKGDDIILSVISDGRFAAIDMRFVDPALPSDPNSKLNYAINDLAEAYKETANKRYTSKDNNGDTVTDKLPGSSLIMFTDIGLGEQSAETRGFDMKQWINTELVRLGVKKEHIAFIGDYDSHAKKGVLFEEMREGKKRILIGGKGMETGMNIQKRLSHLFHLDAPWFPASVEQREGRIIRQGNQNAEVFVKAFATKGSYDSTMWSLVATKGRFIEQAMSGDSSMRSMDDVSEASSFEQAAALSSGDQRYVELAMLKQKADQLDRASTAHYQRRDREQREIKNLLLQVERYSAQQAETKAALKNYTPLTAEVFAGKIGNVSHDKTADFGAQIALDYIELDTAQFVGTKVMGSVNGYTLTYRGVDSNSGYMSEMDVDVPARDNTPLITDVSIKDVRTTGIVARVMNRVNNMVTYLDSLKKDLENIAVRLPLLEKAVARPFDKADEQQQVLSDLYDLTSELEREAEPLAEAKEDQVKFSRAGIAKGSTNTSQQQVIDKLASKFGKSTIDKLIANGTLEIKSLNDYVVDGQLTIPSDVDGIYHQGKAILIADNLSDDMIIPTFLHELGGHGGMQTLMDKKAYDALMRDFDALVKAGDPMAVQAKAMADSVARNKQDALDEYIPYLVTLAARSNAKKGKVAGMINRMVMAIRSWLKNTLGISMKMNAQDVLALAERMVEARTQTPFHNIQSPINSFEGVNAPAEQINAVRKKETKTLRQAPNGKLSNLNEQQWLQVRTPAFKQWFGDWENDPVNASKILDENGEPLVLYHGARSDFWAFDMSRSVPQRNNGMMGMFFTDNAKMAAGYTVDLSKDKEVINAFSERRKAGDKLTNKIYELKSQGKTADEIKTLSQKEYDAVDLADKQFHNAEASAYNRAYANASKLTKAVFINSQAPFEQDAKGESFLGVNKDAAENYATGIYDGVVNNNVLDDASAKNSLGPAKVVISFDATNIKSATDNTGTFDSGNDDIRYSQASDGMKFSRAGGMDNEFDPVAIAKETKQRFQDWATSQPEGKLSWWHKTIGTMYNLAQRSPAFKPVFDNTEKFINDVSYYASKASELAPKLLPKLDKFTDIKKSPIGAKDNDAISKPIFEGTLLWGRDLNGKAVLIDDWRKKTMSASKQDRLDMLRRANRITPAQETELATLNAIQANRFINGIIDEEVSAGLVWTDSELRSMFDLSDDQVALYREFRTATNSSLDSLTRSDILRKLGKEASEIEKSVMDADSIDNAMAIINDFINRLSTAEPKKADALKKTMADIKASVGRTKNLIAKGYAPLSRFGQYTVDVVDADGNREYFGMFESAYDARKMAEEMSDLYGADFVTQGALSKEEFKMFAGVTPETAELFGEMLGLDATGDKAADAAFQEFLKRTKNNRSAMKRLMHRKGIKGYSEDVGRVLASFIYSNARHASAGLNMGNIDRAIADIPKQEGQLKDAAVKLAQYIKNPQEEGSVIRGWMFAQYLGGSIASAMVNLTQPIAVSFPYLSQFGGAKKSAAELTRAASDWSSKKPFAADLQKAIDDAEADGTLSPQEVHNLMKQARGDNPLRAGDGTKYGDSKAAVQNAASRLSLMWGSLFSLAEQINRRVTFVAAYRMAQDQGIDDPGAFARKAIKETQFVYNKASRMEWGRGAVGGTLMTFKTYSVSYIELMHRLWNQGEKGSPERAAGRKAAWIMIGTLFLLGGGGGMPFMEDAEDLIDGAGQIMGYSFSSRKKREEAIDSVFGEVFGDFIESGISGIPGMPTDVSGRIGMGNLIPGTGVFKQRTSNTKDVLELLGPAGDFVSRVGTGSRSILKGAVSGDARQVGRGALELSPVAVRNAVKGSDMLATGIYKDTKGYKVADVSPIDAAFKAIGFQPKDISKIQGAAWLSQSNTAYYNLRAGEIRSLWASGIVDGNKSKIKDAQAALKDWNAKNPDQKIVIRPTDIQRRIREMKMDKSDRVTKLAPKSMRQQIQADFANAQGD